MAETEFTLRVERETARPSPSTVSRWPVPSSPCAVMALGVAGFLVGDSDAPTPDDARAERQAAYAAAYQDALSRRASR